MPKTCNGGMYDLLQTSYSLFDNIKYIRTLTWVHGVTAEHRRQLYKSGNCKTNMRSRKKRKNTPKKKKKQHKILVQSQSANIYS